MDAEIVVAHVIRGAIHALAPEAFPPLGRALIARDDDELSRQLGEQVRRLRREELRDPYLQQPNRALLTPGAELRKRLFRPVASPGAILTDARLAGLWRVKAKGRKAEVTVDRLGGRVPRADLEHEAQRVARLRGAAEALLVDA